MNEWMNTCVEDYCKNNRPWNSLFDSATESFVKKNLCNREWESDWMNCHTQKGNIKCFSEFYLEQCQGYTYLLVISYTSW